MSDPPRDEQSRRTELAAFRESYRQWVDARRRREPLSESSSLPEPGYWTEVLPAAPKRAVKPSPQPRISLSKELRERLCSELRTIEAEHHIEAHKCLALIRAIEGLYRYKVPGNAQYHAALLASAYQNLLHHATFVAQCAPEQLAKARVVLGQMVAVIETLERERPSAEPPKRGPRGEQRISDASLITCIAGVFREFGLTPSADKSFLAVLSEVFPAVGRYMELESLQKLAREVLTDHA